MRKFDSINVIPFIDIMLVLLAIVLTTATFVANGQLDIALPESAAGSRDSRTEQIEIAIDRDEKFYMDGDELLLEQIGTRLQGQAIETRMILVIDETVEFRKFVELIDLLKAHSLDNVSILTRNSR
jgi:biopolymer transport protein ExbD